MPSTRRTRSPASDSLSGATIGTAPPTAASNLRSTPATSAASNSSPPWVASSSLLAVTTGLPSRIASRIRERAGSMPPITSTTTSTSGSATTAAASPLIRVGSTAGSRLRVTSRTATRCSVIATPARSRTGVACSTSSLATPVPTTPHPSIPILSAAPTFPPLFVPGLPPILPDVPLRGPPGPPRRRVQAAGSIPYAPLGSNRRREHHGDRDRLPGPRPARHRPSRRALRRPGDLGARPGGPDPRLRLDRPGRDRPRGHRGTPVHRRPRGSRHVGPRPARPGRAERHPDRGARRPRHGRARRQAAARPHRAGRPAPGLRHRAALVPVPRRRAGRRRRGPRHPPRRAGRPRLGHRQGRRPPLADRPGRRRADPRRRRAHPPRLGRPRTRRRPHRHLRGPPARRQHPPLVVPQRPPRHHFTLHRPPRRPHLRRPRRPPPGLLPPPIPMAPHRPRPHARLGPPPLARLHPRHPLPHPLRISNHGHRQAQGLRSRDGKGPTVGAAGGPPPPRLRFPEEGGWPPGR